MEVLGGLADTVHQQSVKNVFAVNKMPHDMDFRESQQHFLACFDPK